MEVNPQDGAGLVVPEGVLPFESLGDRYAFVDPSGGKNRLKRVAARSAVVVATMDHLERVFALYTWADRCSTERLVAKIIEVGTQFAPLKAFGVEANGLQSLFGDTLRTEVRRRGLRIPIVPVHQPTKIDKDFRIRTALQPVIAEGRLFLQPGHHELRAELSAFPMGRTKDLIDALASVVAMLPKRPRVERRTEELEARLRYLRASGAPASHIEAVAQGRA